MDVFQRGRGLCRADDPGLCPAVPLTQADHNDAQWYVVRQQEGRGRGHLDGWYVVRVCPCHWGIAVTLPYRTKERAEHALQVILGVVHTAQPQEWPERPPHPTRIQPGQVWRRNRHRDARYIQVIGAAGQGLVYVVPVTRDEEGRWHRVKAKPYHPQLVTRISTRRMLNPSAHYYTWVGEA